MAAAVVTPTTTTSTATTSNQTILERIESFLNDSQYKETIESSLNYNTRLCIERRLRLPFIDTQTGVAQNPSSLFMHKRQRIPGLNPGQIYSYPRQRWRKKRRQYLLMNTRAFVRTTDAVLDGAESDMHSISQIENPALMQDTDSKDSQLLLKDEVAKEWFYDEDMIEMDGYDEPDPDSDLDYEETYSKRSRRRKGSGKTRATDSPSTPGRKKGSGRGRKKATHGFDPSPGDPDKPFACELCGARYKTRPGLTYHYGHSHKEGAAVATAAAAAGISGGAVTDENSRETPLLGRSASPSGSSNATVNAGMLGAGEEQDDDGTGGSSQGANAQLPGNVYQDSYVSFLNQTPGAPARRGRQPNNNQGAPPGGGAPSASSSGPQNASSSSMINNSTNGNNSNSNPPTLPPNNLPLARQPSPPADDPPMPVLVPEKMLDHPSTGAASGAAAGGTLQQLQPPSGSSSGGAAEEAPPLLGGSKVKAAPSPYCDFCLGDARENKKTGSMEELVSCADCGRSGHPTCLMFTENMKISVRKYNWQCIECKCCSVCGNSDNDDQLLFCDDCDRGYHMYCLSPPLIDPPEGSWSCKLCSEQFHNNQ